MTSTSFFSPYRCQIKTPIQSIEFSPIHKIFAVATHEKILLFRSEGGSPFSVISCALLKDSERKEERILINWRNTNKSQLLIGWPQGALELFCISGEKIEKVWSNTNTHTASLTIVRWNLEGSHFVVGDVSKICSIWHVSDDTTVTSKSQFRTKSPLQEIVLSHINKMYLGLEDGTFGLSDYEGEFRPIQEYSSTGIHLMLNSQNLLVIITRSLQLSQYDLSSGIQKRNMKLSLSGSISQAVWITHGVLATATGEQFIRFWDLTRDLNFILDTSNNKVISLAYNEKQKQLAAGTTQGRCFIWKCVSFSDENISYSKRDVYDLKWKVPIDMLKWGYHNILVIASSHGDDKMVIFEEDRLKHAIHQNTCAIQITRDKVLIQQRDSQFLVETDIDFKDLALGNNHLVVWSRSEASIFEIPGGNHVSNFPMEIDALAIHENLLYIAQKNQLRIVTLEGIQKLPIQLADEGTPISIDVNKTFLALATDQGCLKVMNISKTDPRILWTSKYTESKVKSIKCNSSGSHVSILSEKLVPCEGIYEPDTRLTLCGQNVVKHYDFKDKVPINHFWDSNEPKLLSCETNSAESTTNKVVTLFIAEANSDIYIQDTIDIREPFHSFIGIQAPKLFFLKSHVNQKHPALGSRYMRYFDSLDSENDKTLRSSLLRFSYYLTIGNFEEAIQSVQYIQNPVLWENMAHMCLHTNRLDIAEFCLSKMGHVRGVEAMRNNPGKQSTLAIQLGLLDMAADLYKEEKRYDLLNVLYQRQGRWKEALEVAKSNDQVHLKATRYNYAKYLESIGDISLATHQFEMAGMGQTEVIRMLQNKKHELKAYIHKKNDPKLYQWLAGYCESLGDLKAAQEYYVKAQDNLGQIRIACFAGEEELACAIARRKDEPVVAYQLGQYYEEKEDITSAVSWYAKSGMHQHALRLAKIHKLNSELMKLALKSDSPEIMVSCADYFEQNNELEMASHLFIKASLWEDVVEICLKAGKEATNNKEMLDLFVSLIGSIIASCPPDILSEKDIKQLAEDLVTFQQQEKAIFLLCKLGGYFEYALDLCTILNIQISQGIAENLTPPKSSSKTKAEKRVKILQQIGDLCYQQQNFHTACKKYTEAGLREIAMKALLKSGDTNKILSYANISNNSKIKILAANYLQSTMDFYTNQKLMGPIIQLYNKARAFNNLVQFFESCALMEIDEYGDYEKATDALKEALKYAKKAVTNDQRNSDAVSEIQHKLQCIQEFVKAKDSVETDPSKMKEICYYLLGKDKKGVRPGDCYTLLIHYHFKKEEHDTAYNLMRSMEGRGIDPDSYIDLNIVQELKSKFLRKEDESEESFSDDSSSSFHSGTEDYVDDADDDEYDYE